MEQDFTPTVHRDMVRNELPGPPGNKVANVANDEIDDYIAYHTRRVLRRMGTPTNANEQGEAEYLIRMLAKADTLERSLSEQGVGDIPQVTRWRELAGTALEELDVETTGEGEQPEKATGHAGWQNLDPATVQLWSPTDVGVPNGSQAAGASERSPDIWWP